MSNYATFWILDFKSMSLTPEEVKHVARLARIGLVDEEIERYQKDLGAILDYIKELEEVNVSGVEPTSHITGVENVMRNDEVREETPEEVRRKLVEMAPEKKNGHIKTKPIL